MQHVRKKQLRILFTIIFLPCIHMHAQNWELFPYGQRSFYLPDHYSNYFDELHADSMKLDAGVTTLYFNIKSPIPAFQACYDTLMKYNIVYTERPHMMISGHNQYLYYATEPLQFIDNIAVGGSWTVYNSSPLSDYDAVTYQLDSCVWQDVFGTYDSVRYFSLHVDPAPVGENAIDDAVIILSKQHGFLQYYSLEALSYPANCTECYLPIKLIGYISGADTAGTIIPKWSDYIKLQPGDYLKFHMYINNEVFTDAYDFSQTIVSVDRYADSVVVKYISDAGLNQEIVYRRNQLRYMFESATNDIGWLMDDYPIYPGPDNTYLGISTDNSVDFYSIPSFPIFKRKFDLAYRQDTTTCEFLYPGEYSYTETYDTYRGLIGFSSGDPTGMVESYLIGSILSGVTWGDYYPVSTTDIYAQNQKLHIIPNPAAREISLSNTFNEETSYILFSASGQIVQSGSIRNNKINIENLTPGIYIIRIMNDACNQSAPFCKINN